MNKVKGVLSVFIILVVVFLPVGCSLAYKGSARDITIQVDDRERVNSRDSGKYLIFTPDAEYQVSDTILFWEWDSSSKYNKLDPGETYEVTVAGWRVPFLSMYPNIVAIKEE